jgi:hypothetical protein
MNPVPADLDGHRPCGSIALPGTVGEPAAGSHRLACIEHLPTPGEIVLFDRQRVRSGSR